MAIKYEELIFNQNVIILQLISTRDKQTGKYLPMMDGNLNVTLNRLYAQRNSVQHAFLIIPHQDLIDEIQLEELKSWVKLFEGKVQLYHCFDWYSTDIEKTRIRMLNNRERIDRELYDCVESIWGTNCQLVSEMPIRFRRLEKELNSIVYNYNWSKCSAENQGFLDQLHYSEIELAQQHKTFLYSNVQYQWWLNTVKSPDALKNIRRSTQIFHPDYMNLVKRFELGKMQNFELSEIILEFINTHDVVFYPMRIEDSRYQFDKVVDFCRTQDFALIITNPTNISSDQYYHIVQPLIDMNKFLDLSGFEASLRSMYFDVLSQLKHTDRILRYESDMHIGLVENILLSNCIVDHPNIPVSEYTTYVRTIG